VNPTIGIELGQTYTFIQNHRTNYMHPLGFAYFPDGAHADEPELEPRVSEGSSGCSSNATCPAPMYFAGGEYAGSYSNMDGEATVNEEDFGLDGYEPLFFYPITEWSESGPYSIQLRFDDTAYDKDLFYFCHIHELMSGRIKLLSGGQPINEPNEPPLGYEYDMPGEFDKQCGTFALDDFKLPHPECPSHFVCGAEKVGGELEAFSDCIDAMNCHMIAGMTTGVEKARSETALFVHQMIPHHQNAVNMAKTLLKTNKLQCDDLTGESPDCVMEVMLREIINGQNHQIQAMRGYLESMSYPETDNCEVRITTESQAGSMVAVSVSSALLAVVLALNDAFW